MRLTTCQRNALLAASAVRAIDSVDAPASTMRALAARGLLKIIPAPFGHKFYVITEAGRAALTEKA
jgi:hypothetical protein